MLTPNSPHHQTNLFERSRGKKVAQATCDRGYRGKQQINGTRIVLPKPPLKTDNRYQRDKKRKQCRRRAAIEPIIGHLKADFRLSRNYLKGIEGDEVNLLLAATAWNLKKWLNAFFVLLFGVWFKKISGTNQTIFAQRQNRHYPKIITNT